MVLVIVNPGCDTKSQDELLDMAWAMLKSYDNPPDGYHHHVSGWIAPDIKFDCIRGLMEFESDDLPTVRPLFQPDSLNPEGNTCVACEGTGRVLHACAENTCPLCGGAGIQIHKTLEPGIFPIALMKPDLHCWAIITPDGRWHGGWQDASLDNANLMACYRHCYGVCMRVKS